jgi:hypothetical protein
MYLREQMRNTSPFKQNKYNKLRQDTEQGGDEDSQFNNTINIMSRADQRLQTTDDMFSSLP